MKIQVKNNYLFYVHRQMGGNESEILSIIEKAEKEQELLCRFSLIMDGLQRTRREYIGI